MQASHLILIKWGYTPQNGREDNDLYVHKINIFIINCWANMPAIVVASAYNMEDFKYSYRQTCGNALAPINTCFL